MNPYRKSAPRPKAETAKQKPRKAKRRAREERIAELVAEKTAHKLIAIALGFLAGAAIAAIGEKPKAPPLKRPFVKGDRVKVRIGGSEELCEVVDLARDGTIEVRVCANGAIWRALPANVRHQDAWS